MTIPDTGEGASPTTFNLLFVCTGNTCRSPMAEVAARHELERRGWKHVRVASAGISAYPGSPATEAAVIAARESGMDLTRHTSRVLDRSLIDWADLILTMGESHLRAVLQLGGAEKVTMLGDFAAGQEGAGDAVSDPYGGDVDIYRETLAELEGLIGRSLDRLAPILQP